MYNSVAELHIGVDLALQKINSNRNQAVKPEEKDWFLNSVMFQMINNHIDPNATLPLRGADSEQRSMDYLNVLKRTRNYSEVFEGSDKTSFKVPLPPDYYRKSRIKSGIGFTDEGNRSTVSGYKFYMAVLPFAVASTTAGGSTDIDIEHYIDTQTLTIGGNVVWDSAKTFDYNAKARYDFSNIRSEAARFMMISTMLEVLNDVDYLDVYWERYGSIYHPNSFVFIINTGVYSSSTNSTIGDNTSLVQTLDSRVISISFDPIEGDIVTGNIHKQVPTSVIKSEEFESLNDNPFFKSSALNVNAVIEDGFIKLRSSDDFYIPAVELVYYRRPRLINYSTGQNCEIASDDFKVQLVNITAQKISAIVGDESYQAVLNENLMLL